jgi:ribosomal protein L37E
MAAVENVPDDFPANHFTFFAFCEDCGHSAAVDRTRIPAGVTMNRMHALLRCSRCGSRKVAVRIAYTGAGGFRHEGDRRPGAETATAARVREVHAVRFDNDLQAIAADLTGIERE